MVKTKINKHITIRPVIKYIVNFKYLKHNAFINHTHIAFISNDSWLNFLDF